MSALHKAWLSVLCLAVGLALACSDKVQASYPTRADAEKSGAIARGWVPSIVPGGSTQIREMHNVDTNEVWGKFVFPSSSTETLRAALNEIDVSSFGGKVRPPKVSWWLPALSGRLSDQEVRAAGLKLYKAEQNGNVFFAVDWHRGQAFFWRPGPYER